MTQSLKIYIVLSIVLSAALLFSCKSKITLPSQADLPNIILIVADDLGVGDLACYGNPLIETPNLDALAKSGIKYLNGYAAAPLCSPTRAAIMTGLSPARLHMTEHIHGHQPTPASQKWITPNVKQGLDSSLFTIPKMLRSVGYSTAHIGKWHLGEGSSDPLACGYQHKYGGSWAGLPNSFFYPFFNGNPYPELRRDGKEGDWLDDVLTNHAISYIIENTSNPFFISLNLYAPHVPIQGKKHLIDYYENKSKTIKTNRKINSTYAAMVHSIDENIGRLIAFLKAQNIHKNTLIIFTSDNGALSVEEVKAFAQHTPPTDNLPYRDGKGYISEGGIKVPFIFSWPAHIKPNQTTKDLAISTDILPTLAHITAAKTPALDGSPLSIINYKLSIINYQLSIVNKCWYFPHYSPQRGTPAAAIRSGSYKFVIDYHNEKELLFNLDNDPQESTNLVTQSPILADSLKTQLTNWLALQAPQPISKNPNYRP
jgi:arylsulfatase A